MGKIQIYVASLADYNAGKLHGAWIDATESADEISEHVSVMLSESKEPIAEEWAIHDFEGFEGFKLSEFESFEFVSWLASMIDTHGKAFVSFLNEFEPSKLSFSSENRDAAEIDFEECFQGNWESESDFAWHIVEESGFLRDCPDELVAFFDHKAYARDLFCGSYIFADGAVFANF